MEHPAYALEVFQGHFGQSGLRRGRSFTCMELGPGDSLFSAVVAGAHGAIHTHLVDDGSFATSEVGAYRKLADYLKLQGFNPPDLNGAPDVVAVLGICKATYHVKGLESLRAIPTSSVDFIWSHAVLEHVRRAQVPAMAHEMRRVLRDEGICSHQIDIRDHLGGALNNLRVPSAVWEREWMARSGFYTNRLRRSEFIRIFESAGFRAHIIRGEEWERSPISRRSLASEFRGLTDEDLRIQDFLAVLRPA
ncbi:MAG: methyltransferase domain-containing protein [Sciscionella sp.]